MKKTFVAFVLDESGSMDRHKNDAIDSFNEQLDAVRATGALGGETRVGVWTLGGEVRNLRPLVDYTTIEPITAESYNPSGMTPLYDAVGAATAAVEKAMGAYVDEDVAALVIIITDGKENISSDFTHTMLTARIKELQDTKHWTFAFMGTTMEQAMAAQQLGMSRGSTRSANISQMGEGKFSAQPVTSYMTQRSRGETYQPDYFDAAEDVDKEE